ncbi:MAG: hypothetical protein J07HX64_00243 [halophilic archaeon J07HX64]|jgi:Uncharacterized conserved protein|nr:MAG: hypothetical protein J07HX64_00243 [halophilic archaeon J07HX64]
MCGRYSLFTPFDDLEERFDVAIETYEPRYNAAPGQSLPVIPDRRRDDSHQDGVGTGAVVGRRA